MFCSNNEANSKPNEFVSNVGRTLFKIPAIKLQETLYPTLHAATENNLEKVLSIIRLLYSATKLMNVFLQK